MAFQIRIVPESLRGTAQKFKNIANKASDAENRIAALKQQLDAAWDGGASTDALSSLEDLKTKLTSVKTTTDDSATSVIKFAAAAEALDGESTSPIPVIPNLIRDAIDTVIMPMCGIAAPELIIPWVTPITNGLRIIPEDVRKVAADCNAVADTLLNMGEELRAAANEVGADWEGKSYNKFREESASIANGYTKLAEVANELATKMRVAATRYEELDASF